MRLLLCKKNALRSRCPEKDIHTRDFPPWRILDTTELLRELVQLVAATRVVTQEAVEEVMTCYQLYSSAAMYVETAWSIDKDGTTYVVSGAKIEKFARRTDTTNFHALNRLRDIMRKTGITHELIRQGAKSTSEIRIGSVIFTLVEQ